MAATVPRAIGNLEALDTDNYEYWSFRVKTYLLGKDLWDVVEDTNEPPEDGMAEFKAWRKNNARALHSIIIACGKDAESFIRGKKTAREAWTTLAETFEVPENLAFFDSVHNHEWEVVKEYLTRHPEAIRAKNKEGETVLHRAVWKDDLVAVKELLPLMKEKDLVIPDKDGDTALYMALLSLTMSSQKPKLARYLYSVTPIDMLERRDRAQLVSIGLQFKILDIPFHILRRYPNFVVVKDHSGESPLSALASTRFGLFSDTSKLPLWNLCIYKGIHMPPTRMPTPGSRPTYFGEIDLEAREEEKNQGKVSWFVAKLRHLSGFRICHTHSLLKLY